MYQIFEFSNAITVATYGWRNFTMTTKYRNSRPEAVDPRTNFTIQYIRDIVKILIPSSIICVWICLSERCRRKARSTSSTRLNSARRGLRGYFTPEWSARVEVPRQTAGCHPRMYPRTSAVAAAASGLRAGVAYAHAPWNPPSLQWEGGLLLC